MEHEVGDSYAERGSDCLPMRSVIMGILSYRRVFVQYFPAHISPHRL